MAKKFDYYGAKDAGYTDEEIMQHLAQTRPDFDFKGAIEAGYNPTEINEYLSLPSKAASVAAAPVKGLAKGLQIPSVGPIPAELGQKIIEHWLPTRREKTEKILEKSFEIAPAVVGGPETALMKGAQIAAGTAGGIAAEEMGFGKGGQTVAEVLSMSMPNLLKNLGLKVANLVKTGFKKGAGEAVAKTLDIKPSEINQEVREAADRLGLLEDLPISAQTTNPKIQMVETRLMQSASGKAIQDKLERTGQALSDTYKDVGKTLSARENMLPSAVSQEAVNVLKNIEENAENAYRSLYAQAEKLLPETAVTEQKTGLAIHRVIDSTINKLRSALGTPAKDTLFNRLTRLKNSFSATPEMEAGFIPIKSLQELAQDFNQVIKYEVKGGVDKMLAGIQGITKQAIQQYGRKENLPYLNRYNQAQRTFGENAKTFRKNPVMRALVKGERPEQIFQRMNTVKGINDLEKVFNKTMEGKETFDALKKYKLEDLLNKKVLDKNGNISWGKASGMFKEPKTRDLVIKLVGSEQYKKLKDLAKVASGVEEGFKKFINPSKTAATAFDMGLYVGLPIKAAQQLFSGNILGASKTVASILLPSQLAKLIANPEFVEAAINTAKAGKGSNAKAFLEYSFKVAYLTAAEIAKNPESPK